jgi:uncharacterized protein (DUF2336 family)
VTRPMRATNVTELLSLAADRSGTARAQLVGAIADFFIEPDVRLTDQERALMSDVLGKLITTVEQDIRRHLSESLARAQADLPELERMLAFDDIEVARPLLSRSQVLRDEDLIEIVKERTDEHRLAIALRDKVSADVSDALIDHAGPDVLEALIKNADAQLSRRAMEFLVAESRRFDQFQEPLLNRNDMPVELAYRMYWWVSAALRAKILREYTVDESMLDDAMQEAAKRALADYEEGQTAQSRAIRLAKRMREMGELTDAFLLGSLRQSKISLFIAGLAERARITYRIAWQVVSDQGFESFIVLARAIGMGRDTLASMVLLLADVRTPDAVRRPDVLREILKLFDDLDERQTHRVLRLWQRDLGYQRAVDEMAHAISA